jgi:hypothetical protein
MGRRQKAKIQEQDLNINLIYCNVSIQKQNNMYAHGVEYDQDVL